MGQHPWWGPAGRVLVVCTQHGSSLPHRSIPTGRGAGAVPTSRWMLAAASEAGGAKPELREAPAELRLPSPCQDPALGVGREVKADSNFSSP